MGKLLTCTSTIISNSLSYCTNQGTFSVVTLNMFGVGLRCTFVRSTRCWHAEASDQGKNGLELWPSRRIFGVESMRNALWCTKQNNYYEITSQ